MKKIIKKYFYKYSPVYDLWVKEITRLDDNLTIVSEWNNKSLKSFVVKTEELLSFWEYLVYILIVGRYSSTDRFVLSMIYENKNKISFSALSQLSLINENELTDILNSLNKKGMIDVVDDKEKNTKTIKLSKRGSSFFKPKKKRKKKIGFIILVLLLMMPSSIQNKNMFLSTIKPLTFYEMVEKRKEFIETQDFNFNLYVEYLNLLNIKNKLTVVSQSILETNTFTSDIFYENNNLFGMKKPRIRKTKATGINRGHATYNHWTDSVKDYYLWYVFITRNREYDNYHAFLNAMGYAEDSTYVLKLKSIENNLLVENRKIIK